MAYIIQQRRDTADNWSKVNPVLANSEIGFILDLGEDGKQKTSLYKIGDGKTAWNELPLFGWGGNIYGTNSAWTGSDLDNSLASQQAILDKIAEKIAASEENTEKIIDDVKEEVSHKLSQSQLVQLLHEGEDEFEEGTLDEDKITAWSDQIVSRAILLAEFKKVWEALGLNEDNDESFIQATNSQLATLKTFADTYGPIVDGLVSTVESHDASIEKHEKDIYGWDEEVVTGTDEETGEEIKETVHHQGITEKIDALESLHNILTQEEFDALDPSKGGAGYEEGKLYFTYIEESEEEPIE